MPLHLFHLGTFVHIMGVFSGLQDKEVVSVLFVSTGEQHSLDMRDERDVVVLPISVRLQS